MTDDTTKQAADAMSHERLAAIHGRLALISAWPWKADGGHVNGVINQHHWTPLIARCPPDGEGVASVDAEFIAHAPEDVDALLAEVDRLRAKLERVMRIIEVVGRAHRGNTMMGDGIISAAQDILREE